MFTYEKNRLKIYNYSLLLHLNTEEIDILYRKCTLRIMGENLRVVYYAKEEIHLEGNIKKIEMEHHDEK